MYRNRQIYLKKYLAFEFANTLLNTKAKKLPNIKSKEIIQIVLPPMY